MSIIAVWGPPQSGKTTVAIDLATALSRKGQSVCLISPELYSELAAKLNIQITKEKSLIAAIKRKESLKQVVHEVDDLFFALAMPFDNDAFGDDMPQDTAKYILEQAESLYDVVIVDCPAHTGSSLAAWALNGAETVLMMSGAHSAAVMWNTAYRRAVEPLEDKTLHICVEVNDSFDYRTLHTSLDIDPDVWLPYFPNAAMLQLLKHTLYQANGRIGREYTKGIDELCALIDGEEEDDE